MQKKPVSKNKSKSKQNKSKSDKNKNKKYDKTLSLHSLGMEKVLSLVLKENINK